MVTTVVAAAAVAEPARPSSAAIKGLAPDRRAPACGSVAPPAEMDGGRMDCASVKGLLNTPEAELLRQGQGEEGGFRGCARGGWA